jgi:hypothetical protein
MVDEESAKDLPPGFDNVAIYNDAVGNDLPSDPATVEEVIVKEGAIDGRDK